MSNMFSKIKAKCMETIRSKPGVMQSEMYLMNIGHRSSIGVQVSRLVYAGRVVRVWDDIMLSWRLYPKGKEPPLPEHKIRKKTMYPKTRGFFRDAADLGVGEGHGDRFYMAFDVAFGLLYIDLKILGMAAQDMII